MDTQYGTAGTAMQGVSEAVTSALGSGYDDSGPSLAKGEQAFQEALRRFRLPQEIHLVFSGFIVRKLTCKS
jgi:hypothetical protein